MSHHVAFQIMAILTFSENSSRRFDTTTTHSLRCHSFTSTALRTDILTVVRRTIEHARITPGRFPPSLRPLSSPQQSGLGARRKLRGEHQSDSPWGFFFARRNSISVPFHSPVAKSAGLCPQWLCRSTSQRSVAEFILMRIRTDRRRRQWEARTPHSD